MGKCKTGCPVHENVDLCCKECQTEGCTERCQDNPNNCGCFIQSETGLQTFMVKELQLLQKIAQVVTDRKRLEEEEKALKDKLKAAMEQYDVKKYSSGVLNITYIAATTETRIDSKLLKEELPDVWKKYSNTNPKSAYIKIEVK